MVNPFTQVNWNPDRNEKRKFALSLMIGFPCLALVFLLVGRAATGHWQLQQLLWLGGGGLIVGLILWTVPSISKPFYLVWYLVACSIGIVLSNLLLISFYLFVVTLVGLVLRAFGHRALRKGFEKQASSYWKDVAPARDVRQYYRQF